MESLQSQSLNKPAPKKRLQYIDIAKGLGIMLVILSHTEFWSDAFCRFFRHTTTIFFMPLFFLLSGLFYKPQQLKKRTIRLLISFLFFYTITIGVHLYPVLFKGKPFDYNEAFGFLLGHPLEWNGPLWFLISLTSIIIIAKKLTTPKGLILSMLVTSTIILFNPNNYYYLGSTLLGLSFFITGNIFKDFFCHYYKWKWYLSAVLFVIISYFTHPFPVCGVAAFIINISWMEFFSISILSIFVIIGTAQFIEKIPIVSRILLYIGENSLIIFATHFLIYERISFLHHEIISPTFTCLLSLITVLLLEVPLIFTLNKYCSKLVGK